MTEIYTIDPHKKRPFLKRAKRNSFLAGLPFVAGFVGLLVAAVCATSPAEQGPLIGMSLFLTIFTGGTFVFAIFKRIENMALLLNAEFHLDPESITVIYAGREKKTFQFMNVYIVKEKRRGTYVFNGKVSNYDLYWNSAFAFFDKRNIFIPAITDNYSALKAKIDLYKTNS
jgi:hypothetical protein